MHSYKRTAIAALLGILAGGCLSAFAEDQSENSHVFINVEKTNDQDALVDLKVDGNAETFTLPKLQMGETRDFITKSGKTISVTKSEKGLEILMDGKTVHLPDFAGNFGAKIQGAQALQQVIEDKVVISGVDLDENQRQIILNAFAAAGVSKKIVFSNDKVMFLTTSDISHIDSSGSGEFEFVIKTDNKDSDGQQEDVKVQSHIIQIEKH